MTQFQTPTKNFEVKEDTSLGEGRTVSADYPKGCETPGYEQHNGNEQKVGDHEEMKY